MRAISIWAGLLIAASAQAQSTHTVFLTDTTIEPGSIVIQPGDQVTWQALSGFHNVESCDGIGDPPICGGQVATEGTFSSGSPAFPPWSYSMTFNLTGENRYFCSVHVGLTPVATVSVEATSDPPGVPDGITGAAMLAEKVSPGGSSLTLTFDVTACSGAADHQVIFGGGSTLPGTIGGAFSPSGGACAVGGSPFAWNGVPDPSSDPTRLLWYLVLATDGADTEGSWGLDGGAVERIGPGAGGASGQCVSAKSLTNACP